MSDKGEVNVSYLITTRNRGDYLRRTLENIRDFITADDELVIIDGLSSDCTSSVVAANSDIVTLFLSESDTSEGHAFNKGLSLVRGRFVKPITDDDYVSPDGMRRLVNEMEANPHVEAILCGGEVWEVFGEERRFTGYKRLLHYPVSTQDIYLIHHGLGLIFRRDVVHRLGGISPGYVSVDGDLVCKLIEAKCKIAYLDINLYRWFKYEHSGVNKTDAMTRNYLTCLIRLNQWESVFCTQPEVLRRTMGMNRLNESEGFANGLFILARIGRSRLGFVLRLLSMSLRVWRRATRMSRKSLVRSTSMRAPPTARPQQSGEEVFSGRLVVSVRLN